jgi:hypothetical protein
MTIKKDNNPGAVEFAELNFSVLALGLLGRSFPQGPQVVGASILRA